MKRGPTGYKEEISSVGERCMAFVPHPLPPVPALDWSNSLMRMHQEAATALGRLDGITTLLPEPQIFLYSYIRKEAVLSSQIEGTQSSLSDLLLFESDEAPGAPLNDVVEVSNYVEAMNHGLRRIEEGFPLSLRLIKEIHAVLLDSGRGSGKQPGEFRTSQNWIGGSRPGNARFVPPPPGRLIECMGDLEGFLHDRPEPTTPLVKAALAHLQFETIHPFLDGNGRVGRLLITLLLCAEKTLGQPILYLSLFFKRHRDTYYDLLQRVRADGDWEAWLDFFFHGVRETSEGAFATAKKLLDLFSEDRKLIQPLGRATGSCLQVHHFLQGVPLATAGRIAASTNLSSATVNKALALLEKAGIISEVTGGRRNRLFSYRAYLDILNEGTEPL